MEHITGSERQTIHAPSGVSDEQNPFLHYSWVRVVLLTTDLVAPLIQTWSRPSCLRVCSYYESASVRVRFAHREHEQAPGPREVVEEALDA